MPVQKKHGIGNMCCTMANGAHDADRTHDLVLTKDVLCQLSYVGEHSIA